MTSAAPAVRPASNEGRPLAALLAYLLAVFLGGALLAPWLYLGVQSLAASIPALADLAEMPFGRYVNRALLITALLGLPLFIRGAGIRRWGDVGMRRPIGWRRLGVGFALGFFSLAAVCSIALLMGGRVLRGDRTPAQLVAEFLGALLTAAVVGVIEELLFRGAIYGGLRRAMPWGAALLASSAIYGIVHFLTRPVSPETIGWASGLRALPTMLAGATELQTLVPAFLSLTLAGVVLGLAYERTGDLWASIGIHAGWIVWLKFYGLLTKSAPGADEWFWGTRKLIDGWMAFIALVVVLAIVIATIRVRPRPVESS